MLSFLLHSGCRYSLQLAGTFAACSSAHLKSDLLNTTTFSSSATSSADWSGALNFLGHNAIYGRYWGAVEEHPFLHFELCYYQAIDYAIAHGLARVEAGAQGEHKIARGYLPTPTYSAHWIGHEGFRQAVADYLVRERAAVGREIDTLATFAPFKLKG